MTSSTKSPESARSDLDAIIAAVTDYAEGWYTGDPERLRRCLHPELVKRWLKRDPDGREFLEPVTAEGLALASTDRRINMPAYLEERGLSYHPDSLRIDVDEIDGGIASVRCRSMHYLDFVHLARTRDGWKLVHALWCDVGGEESERYRRWIDAREREMAS